MRIRVLGCSGSIAAGSRTTSFLVDDSILIDAGTGVGDLTLDEMVRIDHVFITHSHLDHVVSIGLLADSVTRRRVQEARPPVLLHALPATIAAIRAHLFNWVIWPDFTRLPSAANPVLAFRPLDVGDIVEAAGRRIEALSAAHTVPAVGYAVHGSEGAWVFTGDTGPNPALWSRLSAMRVRALVIDTAFGDEELEAALQNGHLCPSMVGTELARLHDRDFDVYVTHVKPGEVDAVASELRAFEGTRRPIALQPGHVVALPD